jgi:hypothetical protein
LRHRSPLPLPQSAIETKFAAVNRHALDEIVNLYSPEAQKGLQSLADNQPARLSAVVS